MQRDVTASPVEVSTLHLATVLTAVPHRTDPLVDVEAADYLCLPMENLVDVPPVALLLIVLDVPVDPALVSLTAPVAFAQAAASKQK
jgi:hypothetical protein